MTDIVESFQLDHRKVKAPYVRKADRLVGPRGDVVTKFDLRFLQPNAGALPTGAIHTLEHLLAVYLREELEGVIDLSPMGCRTGFYLIRLGEAREEDVATALIRALEKVRQAETVPARSAVQCGNYRDLSLFGAQEYAKEVQAGLERKYR